MPRIQMIIPMPIVLAEGRLGMGAYAVTFVWTQTWTTECHD